MTRRFQEFVGFFSEERGNWVKSYRTLLGNRLFVTYWTGSTLVLLGLQFSTIALVWFVLQTTGSPMRIAMVLAVIPIARVVTSSTVGWAMDRFPRRTLMILDNAAQAAVYLSIPLLTWVHRLSFPLLVGLVAVAAALSPISMIGRGVLLPNIVADGELERANGLSQVRSSLVTLGGPALGGVLVGFAGAPITLTVISACYILYVLSLWTIPAARYRAPAPQSPQDSPAEPEPVSARRFLLQNPLFLLFVVITLFFNLTYGPLEPALPLLVTRVFHAGAATLGLIWSSFAVGLLLGTISWNQYRPRWTLRALISGIILGWGFFSGVAGLAVRPWQAMLALFCGGFVFAPYNIVSATWQQRLVPDRYRGAVYGMTQSVTSAGLPVGQLIGGLAVNGIGAKATIVAGGAATMLLGMAVSGLKTMWHSAANRSGEG